jgi:hypothetical protein
VRPLLAGALWPAVVCAARADCGGTPAREAAGRSAPGAVRALGGAGRAADEATAATAGPPDPAAAAITVGGLALGLAGDGDLATGGSTASDTVSSVISCGPPAPAIPSLLTPASSARNRTASRERCSRTEIAKAMRSRRCARRNSSLCSIHGTAAACRQGQFGSPGDPAALRLGTARPEGMVAAAAVGVKEPA